MVEIHMLLFAATVWTVIYIVFMERSSGFVKKKMRKGGARRMEHKSMYKEIHLTQMTKTAG